HLDEVVEELTRTDIDHGREAAHPRAAVQHHRDEGLQQPRREVVDDEPVEILENGGSAGTAGTAHPGEDDYFGIRWWCGRSLCLQLRHAVGHRVSLFAHAS